MNTSDRSQHPADPLALVATIWLHRLPVAETARAETITWPSLGSWPLGETIRSRGREGWCDKTTSGRSSLIVWKAHRIHPTEGSSLTSSMLNKYPSLPLDELKHWWSGNLGECSNMRAGMSKAPVTLYCDPPALARRFEISQSAVGSHENTEKI